MMKKLKVATVFSGIGAIEFSLKRLSIPHEIIFACDSGEREIEYDVEKELLNVKSLNSIEEKKQYVDSLYESKTRKKNYVQQTYLENYKDFDENRFFQDIRLLDGTDFKEQVDLFVGGSPCQTFSQVGDQAGLNDTRGTLFYDFARLVNEIKPKVFIFENVRNMVNHDKGKTWKIIKDVFDELGYNISYDILDSQEFGIPQKRKRLFVVGISKGDKFNFNNLQRKSLQYKVQDFLLEDNKMGSFLSDDNGDLILNHQKGSVEEKYYLTPKLLDYVLKGGTKNFYQKPETDLEVARPLLKTMGNRHRAGIDNYYTISGRLRMLTEREAFRLMGFTDEFIIPVSRAQAYKQAGNSIVVDVLMAIVKEIIGSGIIKLN